MKHKYYDMIVAKAENMDLVLFNKSEGQDCWNVSHETCLPVFSTCEYFLCLPQHKDACLHWLNGGKAEALHEDFGLMELADSETIEWGVKSVFMKDSIEIRIKPKKEKRWIGVFKDGSRFKNTEFSYETVDELKAECWAPFGFDNWQFIEIEVEV